MDGIKCIEKLQSHCANMTFSEKVDMTGLFNRSHIKEGNLQLITLKYYRMHMITPCSNLPGSNSLYAPGFSRPRVLYSLWLSPSTSCPLPPPVGLNRRPSPPLVPSGGVVFLFYPYPIHSPLSPWFLRHILVYSEVFDLLLGVLLRYVKRLGRMHSLAISHPSPRSCATCPCRCRSSPIISPLPSPCNSSIFLLITSPHVWIQWGVALQVGCTRA